MPKVYNVLRSGDEGPSRWMVVRQPDAPVVAAGKGRICHRCNEKVGVSRDSDVYLLVGDLHRDEREHRAVRGDRRGACRAAAWGHPPP
jgi:hypothetical protein